MKNQNDTQKEIQRQSEHFFKTFRQKNHGDRTKYGKKDRRKNSMKGWE